MLALINQLNDLMYKVVKQYVRVLANRYFDNYAHVMICVTLKCVRLVYVKAHSHERNALWRQQPMVGTMV